MNDPAEDLRRVVALLIDRRDELRVSERSDRRRKLFDLRLHPEDRGKVIGREGRTIRALRCLVAARGRLRGEQYVLDVAED